MSRVRVYIASSLDGFIAGPNDDLSWLPGADGKPIPPGPSDPGAVGFLEFIKEVGCLLMGRRTFDVASGFEGGFPAHGETPVLVATNRPIQNAPASVRAVSGSIASLVAQARDAARGKDVYIDGGNLIRQALDAGLIDHLIVTVVPVAIGGGVPLFAGIAHRAALKLTGHYRYEGSMIQLHFEPMSRRQPPVARPIVLASASPRRAALMRDAGYDPVILPAETEEPRQRDGEAPRDYALRAAEWKADSVAARIARARPDLASALIVASDTVADLNGQVLGKPDDDADARRILRALSGTTHTVWTALVVRDLSTGARRSGVDGTRVTMRPLTDAEIAEYVASGEAAGKAGAYAVQETGDRFVSRLEGAFDTVVGLPVSLLTQFLAALLTPRA